LAAGRVRTRPMRSIHRHSISVRSFYKKLKQMAKVSKKRGREFNFSRFANRHIALKLAYDGRSFTGLATQGGGEGDNSVEKHLFEALEKVKLIAGRSGAKFSRAGRTDKGVSAFGQVVALQARSAFRPGTKPEAMPLHPSDAIVEVNEVGERTQEKREIDYCGLLNRVLPEAIRVLAWAPVTEDFSARFSAESRSYRYFFSARGLDLSAMDEAARLLIGSHDFRNFCKMDVVNVRNFRRRVYRAAVRLVGHAEALAPGNSAPRMAVFEVEGNAFLWHMVRCIMQVLTYVGRGVEQPHIVSELLDVELRPKKPHYPMAEDTGLVLHDCGYGHRLDFDFEARNLAHLQAHLTRRYEIHAVEASKAADQLRALAGAKLRVEHVKAWLNEAVDFAIRKGLPDRAGQRLKERLLAAVDGEGAPALDWSTVLLLLHAENVQIDHAGHLSLLSCRHTPLLEREAGPAYEEKIRLLGEKRRNEYEEKLELSRKGQECEEDGEEGAARTRDKAFFQKMLKQGKMGQPDLHDAK